VVVADAAAGVAGVVAEAAVVAPRVRAADFLTRPVRPIEAARALGRAQAVVLRLPRDLRVVAPLLPLDHQAVVPLQRKVAPDKVPAQHAKVLMPVSDQVLVAVPPIARQEAVPRRGN
jgi:hypothetical protein